jgi:manganese/iron transport system ATP-binding protein
MNEEKPGIITSDLTVTYNNGNTALRNVSFEIPQGTITALVGVKGEISILGQSVKSALKGNSIAYVPQAEEVDWSFPVLVRDVVMMGRYGHMGFFRKTTPNDILEVDYALNRVGMADFKDRQIGELSGGQRKRVFLARALAQKSQVILLDEPFTGVDVKTETAIIELLGEMRKEGKIMLVSTHNLGSVPEFCDRTILIKETVLAYGKTENTFTRQNLELAFGGVLRHFVLSGTDLHDDDDRREVRVISDDERPFVLYDSDKKNGKDV